MRVSFNNGTLNPSGEAGTFEHVGYQAVDLAFMHIQKTREILPHPNIHVQNLTLGLYEFDPVWALNQLKALQRKDLGVAMLAGNHSQVAMGVPDFPQLQHSASRDKYSCSLTSEERYPLYMRVNVASNPILHCCIRR